MTVTKIKGRKSVADTDIYKDGHRGRHIIGHRGGHLHIQGQKHSYIQVRTLQRTLVYTRTNTATVTRIYKDGHHSGHSHIRTDLLGDAVICNVNHEELLLQAVPCSLHHPRGLPLLLLDPPPLLLGLVHQEPQRTAQAIHTLVYIDLAYGKLCHLNISYTGRVLL